MLDVDQVQSQHTERAFPKKTYTIARFAADLRWLARHLDDVLGAYLGDELGAKLREEIMTAVAFENACRWCSFMHSEWAIEAGVDADELEHLVRLNPNGVADDAWAAAVYARHLAAHDFGELPAEIDREARELFDAHHRDVIEAVARMMTLANLVGNTFDAFLSRLRGQPAEGSRVLDEVFFSALFAAAAPPAALGLALMRGEGPFTLRRKFAEFSEYFEQNLRQGRMAFVGS